MATGDFGTTDIGLDNVRVTYSACLPVSNLTATNVTSTSAQLSFTPPAGAPAGTTYDIEYGLQGFVLGSGTKVTGLTAATYTLTNLTQSKDYCFYVRQNCGTVNGASSYAGPVCFTTPLPVPGNDDPCGAVALGNTVTTSNNVGASTSIQNGLTLPTCSGAQLPKDVWFSFTATAASMPLTVTGTAAGVVQVYSSPSCSAGPFTRVFCQAGPNNNQNVGPLTITGLTPGTRYYLSVSGYGSGDTQGTFTIPGEAASALGLPQKNVTAIVEYMGGGFGSKFGLGLPGDIACQLSKKAKAPVKLMLTRPQEFLASGNRNGSLQRVKAGATKDGKLVALIAEQHQLGGLGEGGLAGLPYIYNVDTVYREVDAVHTHQDASVAMRGPGHPQPSFAMESLVDDLAAKIGMDPIEFRKKNTTDMAYHRQLDMGAKEIKWETNNFLIDLNLSSVGINETTDNSEQCRFAAAA